MPYGPASSSASIRAHIRSLARVSHGCSTPRAWSTPAIGPVVISEAGRPSCGCHHGACGQPSTLGSTDAAPPSAGAVRSSQSQAPAARPASQASASCSVCSARATAAGWLAGVRPSGSSAWPKPPSGLR